MRHTIGYDRLDGPDELALLHSIYTDLRLYINFFQPVLKLVGKERIDGKTVRTYDQARTPYRRVMALDILPVEVKAHLTAQYVQLNPCDCGPASTPRLPDCGKSFGNISI